jgi:hypothetical protein
MKTTNTERFGDTLPIVLQVLVVLSVGGLLSVKFIAHGAVNLNLYGLHAVDGRGDGRNERSTPRSFVLPASPAVAFAEEDEKDTSVNSQRVSKCVAALRTLGYQIDSDESLRNAKVVEAFYIFQSDQHLPTTGRPDELTMRALKCF